MSDGPYGRHGFNANPGYGGASYGNAGGGYAAPSYGQSYGGASYAAPSPQDSAYGSQYGSYGGTESYQVGGSCHRRLAATRKEVLRRDPAVSLSEMLFSKRAWQNSIMYRARMRIQYSSAVRDISNGIQEHALSL